MRKLKHMPKSELTVTELKDLHRWCANNLHPAMMIGRKKYYKFIHANGTPLLGSDGIVRMFYGTIESGNIQQTKTRKKK